MFQPARPQQQQAKQQSGQNGASIHCQSAAESSSQETSISRRAAIGGSFALAAAAANLQAALPAAARQVVSSDWEKIDLPVDPGVVLLDIGFADDKHGETNLCTFISPVQSPGTGFVGSALPQPQWREGLERSCLMGKQHSLQGSCWEPGRPFWRPRMEAGPGSKDPSRQQRTRVRGLCLLHRRASVQMCSALGAYGDCHLCTGEWHVGLGGRWL